MEVSIDEPLNVVGTAMNCCCLISSEQRRIPLRDLETEAERKLLVRAINQLSSREKLIVKMRFGLDNPDGIEKTQKEVADLLGISQSYISRLEKKIMQRLKREIVRYE